MSHSESEDSTNQSPSAQEAAIPEREQSKELNAQEYWRRNKALMLKLGLIWFLVSYGFGIIFVDYLNMVRIGGYKLGFWFAQQGSIYTFIVLIFYYTKAMEKLDREFGVEEDT